MCECINDLKFFDIFVIFTCLEHCNLSPPWEKSVGMFVVKLFVFCCILKLFPVIYFQYMIKNQLCIYEMKSVLIFKRCSSIVFYYINYVKYLILTII